MSAAVNNGETVKEKCIDQLKQFVVFSSMFDDPQGKEVGQALFSQMVSEGIFENLHVRTVIHDGKKKKNTIKAQMADVIINVHRGNGNTYSSLRVRTQTSPDATGRKNIIINTSDFVFLVNVRELMNVREDKKKPNSQQHTLLVNDMREWKALDIPGKTTATTAEIKKNMTTIIQKENIIINLF